MYMGNVFTFIIMRCQQSNYTLFPYTTLFRSEQFSQHPIASAIIRKTENQNIIPYTAINFQSITGKGAKAEIEGVEYYIGNPSLFKEETVIPNIPDEQIHTLQQSGKTVMLLGTHEKLLAIIAVADNIRQTSRLIIEKLKELGITQTVMLTGDNELAAKSIAKKIGITDVKADLLPEEKLSIIKEILHDKSQVAMVGDGINDAPALANATVGIAMGGAGTDAALETSDITLMEDDLNKLPYVISLSRRTLQIIKQNISFAFGLKIIALLLVIPGWLTLWIAILADVGATVLVVLNSMRLMDHPKNE